MKHRQPGFLMLLLSLMLLGNPFLSLAHPALASNVVAQGAATAPAEHTATPTPTLRPATSVILAPPADLSTMLLWPEDLPSGFRPASEAERRAWEGTQPLGAAPQVSTSFVSSDGRIMLTNRVLYPLAPNEQAMLDLMMAPEGNPQAAIRLLMGEGAHVAAPAMLPMAEAVGERSVGVTFAAAPGSSSPGRYDGILFRRGDAFSTILITYSEGNAPEESVVELARRADRRLAAGQHKARQAPVSVPAGWRTIIDDSFDAGQDRWYTGQSNNAYGLIDYSVTNGKYLWQVRADKGLVQRINPHARSVSDWNVSVQARQVSGLETAQYGLIFDDNGTDYGFFHVRGDQQFAIHLRYQGKWETLVDWTRTSAIRPKDANKLAVRREGARLTFLINDLFVAQVVNSKLPSAAPGVAIEIAQGNSAVYEFDNFQLLGLPDALQMDGSDPLTLDPAVARDSDSIEYLAEIFGGLVSFDRNLRLVPQIAERWQVSANGLVYTFYLRPNAAFHDGRPVTAEDVQYSLERATDPGTQSPTAATYLRDIVGVPDKLNGKATSIRGVRVVDSLTIALTIDAPKSYFLGKLTYPTSFVVDRVSIERDGAGWTTKPNGTGPYRLTEYVPKKRLVLERNDRYYLEPKPAIAKVVYDLSAPDLAQYTDGTLDVFSAGASTAARVRDPKDTLSAQAVWAPELAVRYIVFNVRKPPFDDPKVRQAFALAIDRQKLIDEQYGKIHLPAKSILPSGMPGYDKDLPDIAYDPARARELLGQSRYAGQLPKIVWRQYANHSANQAIADMLKTNLGAEIAFQEDDTAAFYENLRAPDNPYNAFVYGWGADYPDPESFVAVLFQSQSTNNISGYADAAVDRWIAEAAVEPDQDRRLQLYRQAEAKILQDWAVVPFAELRELWLVKPYVKDLAFPAMPVERLRYASMVALPGEAIASLPVAPASPTATPAPTGNRRIFPSSKLNEWEPRYSTPGTHLELIETRRKEGQGTTFVSYRLATTGLDKTQSYEMWAHGISDAAPKPAGTVSLDANGFAQIADLMIGGFSKGEPLRIALASMDHQTVVFAKVIPFPIQGQGTGGCSISIELASPQGTLFWIHGAGFAPNEELVTHSRSLAEDLSDKQMADAQGAFDVFILPGVVGYESGTANFAARGGACEASADYTWGRAAIKGQ